MVKYTYDSWGKKLNCTGTLATTLGKLNPFRYRGYVYDEETGFYYLKSRYYDPETCRFISADVLLSTGQGVLGHNCYAYCLNDPIKLIDTLGHRPAKGAINPDGEKDEYDPLEKAVIAWCNKSVPLTLNDHLERGGVILSMYIGDDIVYYITPSVPLANGTCWQDFALGYLLSLGSLSFSVEGFVHTHTAYPPGTLKADDWEYGDLGPSDSTDGYFNDLWLFNVSGINRQFIANEKGAIYEFDREGNLINLLRGTFDGSPAIIN